MLYRFLTINSAEKKSESFPVFGQAANLHPPEQSLLVQLRPDQM